MSETYSEPQAEGLLDDHEGEESLPPSEVEATDLGDEGQDEQETTSLSTSNESAPGKSVSLSKSQGQDEERKFVRKLTNFVENYVTAPDDVQNLIAGTLGTTTKTFSVVEAVFIEKKKPTVLKHISNIRVADPVQAGITAVTLSRDEQKHLWTILKALGKVTGPLPASEVTAGTRLVSEIKNLTAMDMETVTEAVASCQ